MSKYTQPILLFGIILPGIVALVLLGVVLSGRGKMSMKKETKDELFENFKQASEALASVESELKVEGRMDQMEYWDAQLKKEFVQSLTQNLNEIGEQFTEDQLIRTELSRPTSRSPLAASTENPHSRFKISFEGGFGPMQVALAELEMRMPQIVLENLDIRPVQGTQSGGAKLRFDATYLAWHDIDDAEKR